MSHCSVARSVVACQTGEQFLMWDMARRMYISQGPSVAHVIIFGFPASGHPSFGAKSLLSVLWQSPASY